MSLGNRSGEGCLVQVVRTSRSRFKQLPSRDPHPLRIRRCSQCPILVWQAAVLFLLRRLSRNCPRQQFLLSAISVTYCGILCSWPLAEPLCLPPCLSSTLSWRSEVASESLKVNACAALRMTNEFPCVSILGYLIGNLISWARQKNPNCIPIKLSLPEQNFSKSLCWTSFRRQESIVFSWLK